MPNDTIPYITMNFEGVLYLAPYSSSTPLVSPYGNSVNTESETITLASGVIRAENVRNVKLSYSDTEVDATLRRHRGNKAYARGMRDFNATLDIANVKNSNGTYPPDVALFLGSLDNRRKMFTAFFLDEELGTGPFGDFLVFFGDGGDGDDDIDKWSATLRPATFGRALDVFTTPQPNE
ncbi:hypothetical protein FACS189443_6520 [Planctomycetales bacterium]|nr:hypothetical protein FACS189443_6520 [Planctomycetales bacterium]